MIKRTIKTQEELETCKALLKDSKLPHEDIQLQTTLLLGYYDNTGHLIASGGLEFYGTTALLRSLAVDKNYRSRAIGNQMVNDLFQNAKANAIESIYLLTETAHDYFLKKGFKDIAREDAPEELKKSSEFSSVCPVSASCMVYDLQKS
jgi:amino-acid N-acetyltransferase